MRFLLIYIFIFNLLHIIAQQEKEKIIFAWEMNRHGARAPYRGVVNGEDAYKEKWIDLQELSNVGKRMLYLLGVSLRKRYINDYKLVSSKYDSNEIYIRSTDVNRTIESMECLLQGFFPNGTGKIIKKEILKDKNKIYPLNKNYSEKFDKIINDYNLNEKNYALPYQMSIEPIHLFYKPDHELHGYDKKVCPTIMKQYEETSNRKELHDFVDEKLMANYRNVFLNLENTTNETFLYDYNNLYKYMDGFICDYTDQRNFNEIDNRFKEMDKNKFLSEMLNYSHEFLWLDYKGTLYPNHNASISGMSPVMRSIINWMEKAIESSKKNETYIKLVFYSAHDSTVGALEDFIEYAFGPEMEYSTFSEVRLIELYINETENDYYVRYVKGVKNGEYENRFLLSFKEFKERIDKYAWSDGEISDFCKFKPINQLVITEYGFSTISKAFMIVTGIIIALLLIFLVYFCSFKRQEY